MVNNLDQRTASDCSQQLLEALKSGSNESVRRALDEIAALSECNACDSRELEFRDLLAGIVAPMAHEIPVQTSRRAASATGVTMQILMHVAAQGAAGTRL